MALQAWGTYGVLWPVVHYELGVEPDLGRHAITVVPQVPDGQTDVAGSDIRLAGGSIDVTARRAGGALTTTVRRDVRASLRIGALLPTGRAATSVRLNGSAMPYRIVHSARGTEVLVTAPDSLRTSTLQVAYH